MINRLQTHLRTLLASELGEDFPDLDLRATAGPAILFYQAAVCGEPMDVDEMVERLTKLLFAPAPAVDDFARRAALTPIDPRGHGVR